MVHPCMASLQPNTIGTGENAAVLHKHGVVEALLEMLELFKTDEVFLRQVVRTLVPMCVQNGEPRRHSPRHMCIERRS